jgi:hypothetical protein
MKIATSPETQLPATVGRIPLWIKWGYTAFMAVLVPVYWYHYGLTNFVMWLCL